MQMLKRAALLVIIIVVSLPIVYIAFLLFGGVICNDVKAAKLEEKMLTISLPLNTTIIESQTVVGNTTGTGNHVEIWVGTLIKTALTKKEVEQYFTYDCYSVAEMNDRHLYPVGFRGFKSLKGVTEFEEYYVVFTYGEAFTQIDIRGH